MGIDEHRGIIIEALQDYRRWFCDGVSAFSDSFSESDNERVEHIDSAIDWLRGIE